MVRTTPRSNGTSTTLPSHSTPADGYSLGEGSMGAPSNHSTAGSPPSITVRIPEIKVHRLIIELIGDSPLIVHKWSEKAKKEILDKQMKVAKPQKEAKNPEQDYRDSLYILPDLDEDGEEQYGFPSVGFKASAVGACRFADNVKMTEARGAFHVAGEMVKIDGIPTMREDMVRVGMGVADIRYRGEFKQWSCKVDVDFNPNAMSADMIVNLFNLAGFGVGVGEWRPERNGSYGRFHVARKELEAAA